MSRANSADGTKRGTVVDRIKRPTQHASSGTENSHNAKTSGHEDSTGRHGLGRGRMIGTARRRRVTTPIVANRARRSSTARIAMSSRRRVPRLAPRSGLSDPTGPADARRALVVTDHGAMRDSRCRAGGLRVGRGPQVPRLAHQHQGVSGVACRHRRVVPGAGGFDRRHDAVVAAFEPPSSTDSSMMDHP